MSDDFHATRIEEMQRLVVSLEAKNERLAQALSQVRGQLVKVQSQLLEVNRPPQTMAVFVSADVPSRQIEAIVNGRRMRLAVAPDLDLYSLSYGQWVRVDDKMVAVAADGFSRSGSIASILEIGRAHV